MMRRMTARVRDSRVAAGLLSGLLLSGGAACAAGHFPDPPAWLGGQTVYEVNLRQFSAAGNVDGLLKELPRLKNLGVGIVWIMPVNPIGLEGRSGQLGSPYAVRDYTQFSSEFGTLDQLKATVAEAHRLGMHVILDWVANHSALDNPWVKNHPDWYKHDAGGQLVHPLPAWTDVAALDYTNPALRQAMIAAMVPWVRDVGFDGFRCDTAEWVPLDFWCQARDALRAIKPVFLLAEGDKPELMNYAFDSAYAWNLPSNTEGIVKGTKTVADLRNFIEAEQRVVPKGRFRLNFTSNHDKNSWEGTTEEQLGPGTTAFAVLTFTLPGLPLIYNGQETGAAEHRLKFFEHDPIVWRTDPMADLYRKLIALRRSNPALWATANAPVQFIDTNDTPSVLAFQRSTGNDRVIVSINCSDQPAQLHTPDGLASLHQIVGPTATPDATGRIKLEPWEACVWAVKK